MLELKALHKAFSQAKGDPIQALDGLSLCVRPGQFVVVIGCHGAGKTALLDAIAGRFFVDSGTIRFAGRDVTRVYEHEQALHRRLAAIDPDSGSRIHPNDLKRIIRALEFYAATGQTISNLQAVSREQAARAPAIWIALVRDREEIYGTVESRTRAMIRDGWIEEVARLLDQGFGPGLELIKAHGYRELAAYVRGETSLGAASDAINKNVRHYVRYQLGWIRQMPEIQVVAADRPPSELAQAVLTIIEEENPAGPLPSPPHVSSPPHIPSALELG